MIANNQSADWTAIVIDFLSRNVPGSREAGGWHHQFTTAYQIGCEALVALGQANETTVGATPRKDARLPDELPRWDDLCVSVLMLAGQNNSISYRVPDHDVPLPVSHRNLNPTEALPPPNISAAEGLGPAHATPEVLSVLQALGLLAEARWSNAAETVLWREQPREWRTNVESDARFIYAVEHALVTIPTDIAVKMDEIVTITDADVTALITWTTRWEEVQRAKLGPKVSLDPPINPEGARRYLELKCGDDLDWLFFGRWRLGDGWLQPQDASRALGIFHDPLATAMRRAVTKRRYPELTFLADTAV
jgi:hypothetical protein